MLAYRLHPVLSRARRRWIIAALTLLISVFGYAIMQALEEDHLPNPVSENPGLKGVLPKADGEAFPPDELSLDAFLDAPEYLEEWMSEVADVVAELYSEDPGDTWRQREIIEQLRKKRLVMLRDSAMPRHAPVRSHLLTMAARLQRRLDLLEAALAVVEQYPPVKNEKKPPEKDAKAKPKSEPKADSEEQPEARPEKIAGNPGRELMQAASRADQRVRESLSAEDAARMDQYLGLTQLKELAEIAALTRDDRESLSQIERNLRELSESAAPQAAVLKEPELRDFAAAVSRLLTSGEQPVAVLPPLPASEKTAKDEEESDESAEEDETEKLDELRRTMQQFFQAVEDYEATNTRTSRQKADVAIDKIAVLAPGPGHRLKDVYLRYYANFNLHLAVSESLVAAFVNDTQSDSGPIRDFILGANVFGNQSSSATLTADVKPCSGQALIEFNLRGQANANTVGVARQHHVEANVYTQGSHQFTARKQITFNGRRLEATGAELWVDPNNRTIGAKTNLSKVPLLGKFADRTAFQKAEEQKEQAEAIAAHKLRDRVKQEFDTEVGRAMDQANGELALMLDRWTREGVAPSVVYAASSETHLRYAARVMSFTELAAERAPEIPPPDYGIAVQVHESLLNNFANAYPIAGRKLTLEQVSEILEQKTSAILGKPINLPAFSEKKPPTEEKESDDKQEEQKSEGKDSGEVALLDEKKEPEKKTEEEPTTFDFDKDDPIRFKIERGQLILTLKAALEISLEEQGQFRRQTISPRVIHVPWTATLKDGKIVLEPGKVTVFAVDEKAPDIQYNKGISGRLTDMLSRQEVNGLVTLPREGKSSLELRIVWFEALNGWVSAIFQ